ncbi:hypothetical protein NQZ68_015180 [Dissostichus eleginoides]|nr:hypothetical protein NQZ68_015180 [Dissostichus eleginoides]
MNLTSRCTYLYLSLDLRSNKGRVRMNLTSRCTYLYLSLDLRSNKGRVRMNLTSRCTYLYLSLDLRSNKGRVRMNLTSRCTYLYLSLDLRSNKGRVRMNLTSRCTYLYLSLDLRSIRMNLTVKPSGRATEEDLSPGLTDKRRKDFGSIMFLHLLNILLEPLRVNRLCLPFLTSQSTRGGDSTVQTKRVCVCGSEPEEDSAVKALVHLRLRLPLLPRSYSFSPGVKDREGKPILIRGSAVHSLSAEDEFLLETQTRLQSEITQRCLANASRPPLTTSDAPPAEAAGPEDSTTTSSLMKRRPPRCSSPNVPAEPLATFHKAILQAHFKRESPRNEENCPPNPPISPTITPPPLLTTHWSCGCSIITLTEVAAMNSAEFHLH